MSKFGVDTDTRAISPFAQTKSAINSPDLVHYYQGTTGELIPLDSTLPLVPIGQGDIVSIKIPHLSLEGATTTVKNTINNLK